MSSKHDHLDHIEPLLYSGDMSHMPNPGIPEHWSDVAKAEAQQVLSDLDRFGFEVQEVDPEADVENFWEHALRATSSFNAAHDASQPISHHTNTDWSEEEMDRRLGPVPVYEEARHAIDPLLMDETFIKHAGRAITTTTYYDTLFDDDFNEIAEGYPEDDLGSVLAQMYEATGPGRAVVKLGRRKTGILLVDLMPTRNENLEQILAGTSDHQMGIISLIGQPGAFQVQEWIPMAYEYRFFVVDGKIVTGAGCVEDHTPFDRCRAAVAYAQSEKEPYLGWDVLARRDNTIQQTAGNPSTETIQRPFLIQNEYLPFAEKVASNLHDRDLGTIVIDVALNELTNKPVVVELNTLPNSGLYASDPSMLAEALVLAEDRGYGSYALTSGLKDLFASLTRMDSIDEIV